MTIYISGKISGEDKLYVTDKFMVGSNKAAAILKREGYLAITIYNPLYDDKIPYEACWLRHMIYDLYILITKCQAIYLMKDWRQSRGARIEYRTARLFKKKIYKE